MNLVKIFLLGREKERLMEYRWLKKGKGNKICNEELKSLKLRCVIDLVGLFGINGEREFYMPMAL